MLRPATEADLERMLEWRNHPEVQRVSLHQDTISPDEHAQWWRAVEADPQRVVLVYERNDRPCGVVTFFDIKETHGKRAAMWGYYLDNSGLTASGELLPAWIKIQREAVKYADTNLSLDILEGEVLDHNEGVRKMNARNGFLEVSQEEQVIGGAVTTVHRVRRTRESQ